jgi:hypothetical protein
VQQTAALQVEKDDARFKQQLIHFPCLGSSSLHDVLSLFAERKLRGTLYWMQLKSSRPLRLWHRNINIITAKLEQRTLTREEIAKVQK